MSPKERSCDSTLMKERWSLIQSGTDRKYIKIRNSCIYVHNKLHEQINNTTGEFQRALPFTPPLPVTLTHNCIMGNTNTCPNLNPEAASHGQSSDWLWQPLKVCLLNTRSLISKLSQLQPFVYSSPYTIYCSTETWLSDSIFDNEILPTGFSIYRNDGGSRGGGVIIAIEESISCIPVPSPNHLELLAITLDLKNPITLCTVYVP